MEENKDIDKIFRTNLEPFEMEPSEKVWTSIQADLDKRKKSRGFGFLWIALIAGAIAFGTYEFLSRDSETALNAVHEVTGTEKNSAAGDHLSSDSRQNKKEVPEENSNEKNISSTGSAGPAKDAFPEHSAGKEDKLNITSHSRINRPITLSTSVEHASFNSPAVTRSNNADETVSAQLSPLPDNKNNFSYRPPEKEKTENKIVQNAVVNEQSGEAEKIPAEKISPQEKTGSENSSLARNEPAENKSPVPGKTSAAGAEKNNGDAKSEIEIPAEEKPSEAGSDSAAENISAGKTAEVPSQEKAYKRLLKKIGSHSSLALFYSPDYAVNRTTGVSNADTRKSDYSWSSGLRMSYELSRRFSISAGASYSSYSRSESFSSVYVTSDSAFTEMHQDDHGHGFDHDHGSGGGGGSHGGGGGGGGQGGGNDHGGPGHDGCHYVVHTSCGDIDLSELPPSTTGNEESGDTLSLSTGVTSKVEFINVPLMVRYNFRSRKLLYYVEAGASINFIRNSEAKITIGSYAEDNAVSGLTNFNYSALLNAGVEYRFYKGISIFFEPNIRYSITPINDSGSEKSYPYFIGGNAGLSIHF
jgi:hypothetical protein